MQSSGALNPSPRCIITPLKPRVLLEIPAIPERPVPQNPNQLQNSFQQFLNDYTRARQNQASDPRKFADCEGNLIRIVSKFRNFKADNPDYYAPVVKLPAIQSMITLLADDECGNLLTSYILSTFEKLTDPDILIYGQHEEATVFVESLVKFEALNVFVSTLDKFPGDDDVYFPALQTIAQMIFLNPVVADIAGKNIQLMEWVLNNALGAPKWNELKEYVVGLLDTLLMSSEENRLRFGELGAVPLVVNALTSLVSPNEELEEGPLDYEDEEYLVETLFSCLLFLLERSENIGSFADAGGVQLMIRFIQQFIQQEDFGYCYGSAIEALDIAVKVCHSAAEKFVKHSLAWNTAFPPSMDKIPPSITHVKEKIEGHHISLFASLTGAIAKTVKVNLFRKFEEDDFKRITWLMELYRGYSEKVEKLELDSYKLRMEKLQYESTVKSIAVILGYLSCEDLTTRNEIQSRLTHHNLEKKYVQDFILVYRDSIGNADKSVESAKTVTEESTDSVEENPNQGMELDVKENPDKRMELDVKENPDKRMGLD
ncbi:hypothetical protein MKW92_012420, partial [Papaver armeniacum]